MCLLDLFIARFSSLSQVIPQTSVALGVLAVLVEDHIPDTGPNLCAGTGLCGLQGVSRGLPPQNTQILNLAAAAVNFGISNCASYHSFYDLPKIKVGRGCG